MVPFEGKLCALSGPKPGEYGLEGLCCCESHESGDLNKLEAIILRLFAALEDTSAINLLFDMFRPPAEPLERIIHTFWCNFIQTSEGLLEGVSPAEKASHILCMSQCRQLIVKYSDIGIQLVDLHENFLAWLDECVRWALQEWGRGIALLCVPRPSDLRQLFFPSIIREYSSGWLKFTTIMLHTAGTDEILYHSFVMKQISTVNQISDFIRASFHELWEHFFLTKDSQKLVQDFSHLMARVEGRALQQQSYIRLAQQKIATRALLTSIKPQCIDEILRVLVGKEELVILPWTGCGYRLVSKSLLYDKEKAQMFSNTCFNHPFWFGNDYVVSIEPDGPALNPLAKVRWAITVDCRNIFKRNWWISELAQSLNLQVLKKQGFTTSPLMQRWLEPATLALEDVALTIYHCIWCMALERLSGDHASATMKIYNFFCLFSLETLVESPCPTPLTPLLLRLFSRACSKWLSLCLFFFENKFISDLNECSLILEYINRMLNAMPSLEYFDIDCVLQSLRRLLKTLDTLRQANAMDKNLEFLRQYVYRSITRSERQGRLLPPDAIPPHSIKIPVAIGEGTNGMVYKCFDLGMNTAIAIKEMRLEENAERDTRKLDEVNYNKYLSHQHIVQFYGVAVAPHTLYLKMELCEGGSISKLIKVGGRLSGDQFRRKAVDIILGLSFLHQNNIVHGDLKPNNLLINQFDSVKLVDFGASYHSVRSHASEKAPFTLGTIQYMAPEVVRGASPCFESDIWSLGCTFFYMVTGISPWCCCDTPWCIIMNVASGKMFDLTPLRESQLDPRVIALIESCLQVEKKNRPWISSLLLDDCWYI